jgi:hypothetical protein
MGTGRWAYGRGGWGGSGGLSGLEAHARALRAELLRNKQALLELLTWNDPVAEALLKDATAYLSEFFTKTGKPDCELTDLDVYEEAVDAAFAERDMFGLRVAVRRWVSAARTLFESAQRDRWAA